MLLLHRMQLFGDGSASLLVKPILQPFSSSHTLTSLFRQLRHMGFVIVFSQTIHLLSCIFTSSFLFNDKTTGFLQ
jgi:hypothetical protein